MKLTAKLIVILGTFFMLSCMDMYNEVADETETEYNYFLAVANNNGTYIYSLDDFGAVIEEKGNTSSTATYSSDIAMTLSVNPTGDFLYILNGNSITVEKINNDGRLSPVETELLTGTRTGVCIIMHPNGKYIYCAGQDNSNNYIWMFQINNDGSLNLISSGTTSLLSPVSGIAFNPTGTHLYVITNSLYSYTIDSEGKLDSSPITYAPDSGRALTYVYVDRKNHVYVLAKQSTPETYYIYLFDSTKNPYFKEQFSIINEVFPQRMIDHPSENILYFAYIGFLPTKINHDGTLTQLTPTSKPSGIEDMVVHPNGKYIYVATGSDTKNSFFQINTDGTINIPSGKIIDGINSPNYGLAIIRKKK